MKRKPKKTLNPGYEYYLKSPRWRAMRAKVIFRDLGMCRAWVGESQCLSRKDVEVHHMTYVRFGNEAMTDLVTLCRSCHKKFHKQQEKTYDKSERKN